MPMPSAIDQTSTDAGIGVNFEMTSAIALPSIVPTTPPNIDSTTDSVSICDMMSRAARAERLAQADLARPLGHDHQHDVHDDDAADDERQPDDADEHREDAVGRRLVDAEDRVGREHAEVVGLLRLEPARAAQRDGRLVLRRDEFARRRAA